MNGDAQQLAAFAQQCPPVPAGVCAVLAVPFVYLGQAVAALGPKGYGVAAQDCSTHAGGAWTGQISATMLADVGVTYALVGHPEHADAHTTQTVVDKVRHLQACKIVPIVIATQQHQLIQWHPYLPPQAICAWEPSVGASGPVDDAVNQVRHLTNAIEGRPVVYGGGVTTESIAPILGACQGTLVGRASLTPSSWMALLNATHVAAQCKQDHPFRDPHRVGSLPLLASGMQPTDFIAPNSLTSTRPESSSLMAVSLETSDSSSPHLLSLRPDGDPHHSQKGEARLLSHKSSLLGEYDAAPGLFPDEKMPASPKNRMIQDSLDRASVFPNTEIAPQADLPDPSVTTLWIDSDHAGCALANHVGQSLRARGWRVHVLSQELVPSAAVDYPDRVQEVAHHVARTGLAPSDLQHLGILICGSGIGMAIAANRFLGVRAALCHDPESVRMARQHNHANILVLGARTLTQTQADRCVDAFLSTAFDAGRHLRRIQKLDRMGALFQHTASPCPSSRDPSL